MSTLRPNLHIEPQDLFTSSSTQGTDLGQYATTGDGRYFRYALAGASTLVPGKLQQGPIEDTTNQQNLAVLAAGTSTNTVTLSGSITLAANLLSGGLLAVTTSSGAGYTYKIKSNTAVSSGTGCVVTLEDALLVNLTTNSKVDLQKNPFNGVIVNPATASSCVVGVPLYPITNAQYGWLQTRGPAAVLANGALLVGMPVGASVVTAGAADLSGGTLPYVGIAQTGVAATEYGLVNLELD